MRLLFAPFFVTVLLAGCTDTRQAEPLEGRVEVAAVSALKVQGDDTLAGRFFFGSPDGEGGLTPDSAHIYLWLEGTAAKQLYQQMPAEVEENACEDGYAYVKFGNALQCKATEDGTRHWCAFAVNIEQETLIVGASC